MENMKQNIEMNFSAGSPYLLKLQLISVAFNDIRCILKFDSLPGGGRTRAL